MADDYPVHVVRVIDGDSVKVQLPDGAEHPVRMYGIDAPEKDQRGGRESHDHLRRVVRSRREWRLRVVDVDRYQRLVGVLYPEGWFAAAVGEPCDGRGWLGLLVSAIWR